MFTYVINTSENRTFENDLLFSLSGYNKTHWMESRLDCIYDKCFKEIVDRQRMLGADDFRIAVIVDFFAFDKVRVHYGKNGYGKENGVDMSLYLPFIEAYLVDSFLNKLREEEIIPDDFGIYYAHGGEHSVYSTINNEREQLRSVFKGSGTPIQSKRKKIVELKERLQAQIEAARKEIPNFDIKDESKRIERENVEIDRVIREKNQEELEKLEEVSEYVSTGYDYSDLEKVAENTLKEKVEKLVKDLKKLGVQPEYEMGEDKDKGHTDTFKYITLARSAKDALSARIELLKSDLNDTRTVFERISDQEQYEEFEIYCTKDVTLKLKVDDYPYGTPDKYMSYEDFYLAFKHRESQHTIIKRYFYKTSLGGAARSAFDTLSLSLYLIKVYEREEETPEENLQIDRLTPSVLKDVLVTAWSKVTLARNVVLDNQSKYYTLTTREIESEPEEEEKISLEEKIRKHKAEIPDKKKDVKKSKQMFEEVMRLSSKSNCEFDEEEQAEFNKLMYDYLGKRDESRESVYLDDAGSDLIGADLTDRCPSEDEFEYVVQTKRKNISKMFDKTLKAEYIQVDFTKEKADAKKAYTDYCNAKACMSKNLLGDIIFLTFVTLIMLVPYYLLQIKSFNVKFAVALPLLVLAGGVFAGLFILAFFIQILPLIRKMEKAKHNLKESYLDTLAKRIYAFSALKKRYTEDLINIEEERYELRRIRMLHEANKVKEKHVVLHRDRLEEVQDKLSSMLNNLDVEPVYNPNESVKDELDITKSFLARENKIYHIFALETIEKMFERSKGERDE